MPLFQLGVTEIANYRHLIEPPEGIRQFFLTEEKLFTVVTPCLKIVRIGAVFDKSKHTLGRAHHMATNDRRNPLAMCAAFDLFVD